MRIAIVTDTLTPQINGVTTVLSRMVDALQAAGQEVAVVAARYPGQTLPRANGQLRVRSVPFPPCRHTDFPRHCMDYGLPSLEGWAWRWLVS